MTVSQLSLKDIRDFVEKWNEETISLTDCSWCRESTCVRVVGANYICHDCELREREAGRPIIFTSPVRNAYFEVRNNE